MEGVRLAELLGGLSLASDVLSAFPHGKAMRTALLSAGIARRVGDEALARDAYYLSLLRALGCTGFAHEEAHEFGAGDDLGVRTVMCLADAADPIGTVRAIVTRVGAGAPMLERARAVLRLLGDQTAIERHAFAQTDTASHVAEMVGMSEGLRGSLRQICERWDGRGAPHGLEGEALAPAMRVYHLADVVEIEHHRRGREAARAVASRRAGAHIDPNVARRFLAEADALLAEIEVPDLWSAFLAAEPHPQAFADEARTDAVALAVACFADLKSVYTLGHSRGVADLADAAGAELGFDALERATLRRAGLLHDVGRLSVPNGIWDRPGKLDFAAWERVRLHAYYTERVLAQAPSLRAAGRIAGAAHERIDGAGYHRGASGDQIARSARVLAAADAVFAMSERRPHRAPLTREAIVAEMHADVARGRHDAESVDAVLAAARLIAHRPRPALPAGLSEREVEVLRLVACGKTNKEIGQLLGISPRTVQNHVAHVYDKIGAYSRAGAAMYAMEHRLLGQEP